MGPTESCIPARALEEGYGWLWEHTNSRVEWQLGGEPTISV